MKLITLLIQPIIYLWLLFLLCTIVLPPSLIALPFDQNRRLKLTAHPWRIFFKLCLKVVAFVSVYKDDRRDIASQNTISPKGLYIGNHQSFMDIPLVYSNFIIPPIMKKTILYIPILGICGYSSGGIIVDRKDPNSRRKVFHKATQRLLTGMKQLQYYPEGTRNKESDAPKPLSETKTALMQFAYKNNVLIYPMSLYGTNKIIQKNIIHVGQSVGIILHEAVNPQDYTSEEDFLEACWNKVISGHKELKEKFTLG